MKELKDTIKCYKKLIIIVSILVLLIPIILVHLLFKWSSGIDFFVAEWSAGEVLEYISTVLTFIGTIILSFLALNTSIKANDLSKKVIEIEQERYKLSARPFVLATDWHAYKLNFNQIASNKDNKKKYIGVNGDLYEDILGFSLELTNTSESFITVSFSELQKDSRENESGNSAINQSNSKILLAPGESGEFIFYASNMFWQEIISKRNLFSFYLENRFSNRYYESFVVIITSITDKIKYKTNEYFCHATAQEYSINRYEKDNNGETILVKEKL